MRKKTKIGQIEWYIFDEISVRQFQVNPNNSNKQIAFITIWIGNRSQGIATLKLSLYSCKKIKKLSKSPLKCLYSLSNNIIWLGSDCGAVGRSVASDTRDPRFDSSHQLFYLLPIICIINCIEKAKIMKKMPAMTQFKNKMWFAITPWLQQQHQYDCCNK